MHLANTSLLEALVFGIFVAVVVMALGYLINKVHRHELSHLTPEQIVELHRKQFGRRKTDRLLHELNLATVERHNTNLHRRADDPKDSHDTRPH